MGDLRRCFIIDGDRGGSGGTRLSAQPVSTNYEHASSLEYSTTIAARLDMCFLFKQSNDYLHICTCTVLECRACMTKLRCGLLNVSADRYAGR